MCVDAKGAAVLATAGWPELLHLDLLSSNVDHLSVRQLLQAHWPCLRSLQLPCKDLDQASLASIAEGQWPNLHELVLYDAEHINGYVVQSFKRASWVPQLHCLNLMNSAVSLDAVGLRSAGLVALTELRFTGAYFYDEHVSELAACHFVHIRVMDFTLTYLPKHDVAELVQASWPTLHTLILFGAGLNARSMAVLIIGKWPDLRCLNLAGNNLTDEASLVHLHNSRWPRLEVLSLSGCSRDDSCWSCREIQQVVKCNWPCLRCLDLNGNGLAIEGTPVLNCLTLCKWPLLRHLDLAQNKFAGVPLSAFGVQSEVILPSSTIYLNDRYHGVVQFAGKFAHGRWPALTCINLAESSEELDFPDYRL